MRVPSAPTPKPIAMSETGVETISQYNELVPFEIDPVCHMNVLPETAAGKYEYRGKMYYFCGRRCLERFRANPEQFLTKPPSAKIEQIVTLGPPQTMYTCPMHPEVRQHGPGTCPKCGMALEPEMVTAEVEEKNPELTDMTRRFWIGTVLSIPVLALGMADRLPFVQFIFA